MFTTLIVQPIFNLLVLIYALLPGHNFGVAIIIFTIIVRMLMWPLVKKQLHNTKAMRELAPELKKIKAASKGDRRKESQLTMELYKERGVNPFSSIGVIIIQLPIFIGLYVALTRIIKDPQELLTLSYSALHNLPWMKELATNINNFDATFVHTVDLTRSALGPEGFYLPAFIIVVGSAVAQFFQSKQLMPKDKESRSLRKILSEAGQGKSADQSEVNAAVSQSVVYLIPGIILIVGLNLPSALPLYWLVGALVAIVQQSIILREDVQEAEEIAATATPTKQEKTTKAEKQPVNRSEPKPKKRKKKKRR